MPRIAHFIYDSPKNPWVAGGGAFRNIEIYSRFPREFQTTIFSGLFKGAHDERISENLELRLLGKYTSNYFRSRLNYVWNSKKFILNNCNTFDLIVEDFSPFSPLFLTKLLPNKKVIGQFQNYFGFRHHFKKNNLLGILAYFFERKGYSIFQNGILISQDHRDFILNNLSTNFKNLEMISYGIAADLMDDDTVYHKKLPSLLYLGRIEIYQKGLDRLLNIFMRLLSEFPQLRLKIAGSGVDQEKFAKMILEKKLSSNIEFIGRVTGQDLLPGWHFQH